MKNKKSGTLGSLCNYLRTIPPDFFILALIRRKQAKSSEENKQEGPPKNSNFTMSQVDFAENFICVAHWKQYQIILFTTMA